jgi:uncharacterized protein YxjI
MGLFRHDEGPEPRRFQMREDLLSIGDDYWIEDESGAKAYKVDGKVARLRDTWVLEDLDGNELARIRERKLSVRDAMTIELAGGGSAVVKKAIVGLRDRFNIEVEGGPDLKAKGDIVDHEYEIERDGDKIAEISKKWFRIRETYGVEVDADVDPVLILAITVAIDGMTRAHG